MEGREFLDSQKNKKGKRRAREVAGPSTSGEQAFTQRKSSRRSTIVEDAPSMTAEQSLLEAFRAAGAPSELVAPITQYFDDGERLHTKLAKEAGNMKETISTYLSRSGSPEF